MENGLAGVASRFAFEGKITGMRSLGEGLINHTYFVETAGSAPNYVLQQKNRTIFKDIPAMMENIHKVTTHLRKKIETAGGDPLRETMTLIPATDGRLYHLDADGAYWTASLFIEDTLTHQYASTLELACQGGKGIGKFQAMLADMAEPLADTLPGFHNIRYRFGQWDETLRQDRAGRVKDLAIETGWIERYRSEMLSFWEKAEQGIIPARVTHNDTKISNILFDRSGEALCVIDLDTVLGSICLNDYGDAIRSYANAGLEDDRDVNNVFINMDVFESYTRGYLSQAKAFLTQPEIDHLAFSVKYITYEQVLRFLMDYIDGDCYYRTNYDKHNLVRAHAQYKLLQSIEENFRKMNAFIHRISSELPKGSDRQ